MRRCCGAYILILALFNASCTDNDRRTLRIEPTTGGPLQISCPTPFLENSLDIKNVDQQGWNSILGRYNSNIYSVVNRHTGTSKYTIELTETVSRNGDAVRYPVVVINPVQSANQDPNLAKRQAICARLLIYEPSTFSNTHYYQIETLSFNETWISDAESISFVFSLEGPTRSAPAYLRIAECLGGLDDDNFDDQSCPVTVNDAQVLDLVKF